jgi:2,4-dienoyl-CoA reductase-like NADH-dependent reductase (Old Yellow Enzyme family)
LGIWKDEHIEGLKSIVLFNEGHGAVTGIQLAHAGRKASNSSPWKGGHMIDLAHGGWETVAPSAITFRDDYTPPVALDKQGIEKVRSDFKAATLRSLQAGFKVIEIHAAHGYLLHEFYSPLTNHRTEDYGDRLKTE